MNHPTVFISYSHDSPEHIDRVLDLANQLRRDGIDCLLDQYETSPPEGWPKWMDRHMAKSDFVIVICTETYCRRVMGEEEPGKGRGVKWESTLTYQHIYSADAENIRFIPVLFESGQVEHIPTPLQGASHYRPDTEQGYEDLYRRLTDQPRTIKPKLGKLRKLPPRERKPDFFAAEVPEAKPEPNLKLIVLALIITIPSCCIGTYLAVPQVRQGIPGIQPAIFGAPPSPTIAAIANITLTYTPTLPTDTPMPVSPTVTATNTPSPTVTPTPTATATHTPTPTPEPSLPTPMLTPEPSPPTPTPTSSIALTIYLRRTKTDFVALNSDQPDGRMIYEEGQTVYGDAAVQIGATTYHFDKPLPDPWRVEFEFSEELIARTGDMEPGFDPKKAQFWVGALDDDSAVGEDNPYSLTMKLYEGDELRESIQVFFAVKDAPGGGGGGGDGPRPPVIEP